MVAERGLAGFALSELARAVGVSGAAPHRHFRYRTAVIAEVARRGFERLAADLEAARPAGGTDPIAALERCAQSHLASAGQKPPAQMVALHVWSRIHGIATLFTNHRDDSHRLRPMSPEELLEAGLII